MFVLHGDTDVVGAQEDDSLTGSAYVFTRDGGGAWTEEDKLIASDAAPFALFGQSVSAYGDTVVVGAGYDDEVADDAGAAYVFIRGTGGAWTQQDKLTASDGAQGDGFGRSDCLCEGAGVVGAAARIEWRSRRRRERARRSRAGACHHPGWTSAGRM